MQLDVQSISYIDNREFPGDGVFYPGPLGYEMLIAPKAIVVIQNSAFVLSNWLADGLLVSPLIRLSLIQVYCNAVFSSYIVVTLSTPRNSGSSPSPASCSSAQWVSI